MTLYNYSSNYSTAITDYVKKVYMCEFKVFLHNALSAHAQMQILHVYYYVYFSKTLNEEHKGVVTASLFWLSLSPTNKNKNRMAGCNNMTKSLGTYIK